MVGTLKNKIYKHMITVSKNLYEDKLPELSTILFI